MRDRRCTNMHGLGVDCRFNIRNQQLANDRDKNTQYAAIQRKSNHRLEIDSKSSKARTQTNTKTLQSFLTSSGGCDEGMASLRSFSRSSGIDKHSCCFGSALSRTVTVLAAASASPTTRRRFHCCSCASRIFLLMVLFERSMPTSYPRQASPTAAETVLVISATAVAAITGRDEAAVGAGKEKSSIPQSVPSP